MNSFEKLYDIPLRVIENKNPSNKTKIKEKYPVKGVNDPTKEQLETEI